MCFLEITVAKIWVVFRIDKAMGISNHFSIKQERSHPIPRPPPQILPLTVFEIFFYVVSGNERNILKENSF
jgi:hypothetical protein